MKAFVRSALVGSILASGCGQPSPTAPSLGTLYYEVNGILRTGPSGSGAPVEGAVIATTRGATVRTGSDGRYTLPGYAEADAVMFDVEKAGYAPTSFLAAPRSGTQPRVVTVELWPPTDFPDGRTISGLIYEMTPAGPQPVPGVTLSMFGVDSGLSGTGTIEALTTDSEGRFSLATVQPADDNYTYYLQWKKAGYRPTSFNNTISLKAWGGSERPLYVVVELVHQ